MKQITSRANPLYKQLLASAKQAGRPGHAVWLEGTHLCQAWLQYHVHLTWAIFDEVARTSQEIQALVDRVPLQQQVWVASSLMSALSTLKSPANVMFVVDVPPVAERTDLEENVVMLDDIQDPVNVGTILRTTAAAGIRHVVTTSATASCWSPKVLRGGQGAQFALQMQQSVDMVAWLKRHRSSTVRLPVIATTLEQSKSLYATPLPDNAIWVFGHEGRGVSPEILALADHRLSIPHDSQAIESLNVASAVAVCLFEQRRQRLARLI